MAKDKSHVTGAEKELRSLIALQESTITYTTQLRDDDAYFDAQLKKLRLAAQKLNEQADRLEAAKRDAPITIAAAEKRIKELKRDIAHMRNKRDMQRLAKLTERVNDISKSGEEGK